LKGLIKIRRGAEKDVSAIEKMIAKWLKWEVPREKSIRRAVRNKELLVADRKGEVIGFIHYAMHEDIVDGGSNCFITAFYVAPEFREKEVGTSLLRMAIRDALEKGAVGIETSTANPEARRLYENHNFKQFMGLWSMGEVFLELDVKQYKQESMRPLRIHHP
jgi:ribosomal protein S18 acetylase RimI-like enzyme